MTAPDPGASDPDTPDISPDAPDGDADAVDFPMPVVAEAPPPGLRYRRALDLAGALRSLWRARRVVLALVVRQVRSQYSQQFLGLAWAILTPFAQTILFTLLLNKAGTAAGVDTEGVPKSLFLYLGLVSWAFYASSVSSGGTSLVGNPLLNKVYAPREVFPIAQVASSGINAVAALLVLPLLFLVAGRGPSSTAYWAPVLVVVLVAFAIAIALIVSSITVYLRDLRSGLPLFLQLGMFMPGVLYRIDLVISGWPRLPYAFVFPVGALLDGLRRCVFLGAAPDARLTLVAASGAVAYLAGGFLFFKRLETGFADVS